MNYSITTACFIAFAKLPSDTPLYEMHKSISIGFVVNYETGDLEDVITSLIVPETKAFLKDVIMPHNIHREPVSDIVNSIRYRFHGSAQKAICIAFKQCYDKYYTWRETEQLPIIRKPSESSSTQ